MRLLAALLALLAFAWAADWNCTVHTEKLLYSGVTWTQQTCQAALTPFPVGPLVFNVIDVNLSTPGVRVVPVMADPSAPYRLQTVPEMAAMRPHALAAVNGGYFWELNNAKFRDDVCWGKTRADAMAPVNGTNRNAGVGDGFMRIDGTTLSLNCDCIGYDVPTMLVLNSTTNGTNPYISLLSRGERVGPDVVTAITAGPSILSDGVVEIPSDDHNVNIFGHTSNTAIGLRRDSTGGVHVMLATANGHNGGSVLDPTSGIDERQFGYFMRDVMHATHAMAMDQGGSTTMWVRGEGNGGLVSNPGENPRNIFNAVFVEVDS